MPTSRLQVCTTTSDNDKQPQSFIILGSVFSFTLRLAVRSFTRHPKDSSCLDAIRTGNSLVVIVVAVVLAIVLFSAASRIASREVVEDSRFAEVMTKLLMSDVITELHS
jgi:hypothetical protein